MYKKNKGDLVTQIALGKSLFCRWWAGHAPSMFQLSLSSASTQPLANGSAWHHRLNVGSTSLRPVDFAIAWPGAVAGSLASASFGEEYRRRTAHSVGFRPPEPRREPRCPGHGC